MGCAGLLGPENLLYSNPFWANWTSIREKYRLKGQSATASRKWSYFHKPLSRTFYLAGFSTAKDMKMWSMPAACEGTCICWNSATRLKSGKKVWLCLEARKRGSDWRVRCIVKQMCTFSMTHFQPLIQKWPRAFSRMLLWNFCMGRPWSWTPTKFNFCSIATIWSWWKAGEWRNAGSSKR